MKSNALFLFFACLFFTNFGCDKCKETECFTPPSPLRFQLVDKDSGEDLVINGTYKVEEVSVISIEGNKKHALQYSKQSETEGIFADPEIGWVAAAEKFKYMLKLDSAKILTFTYETREVNQHCCTIIELVNFKVDSIETLYLSQKDVHQLKI